MLTNEPLEQTETEEVSGTIAAVIFSNLENGYSVIRLRDEDISPEMGLEPDGHLICAGQIPVAACGLDITCEGQWINDERFGRQFKVTNSYTLEPMTESAIFTYLSSGAIKGIGPATASLIVNEFGRDSLEILEAEPEKLTKIRGITASKAKSWSDSYKQITGMRRLIEFLSDKMVRTVAALRLYRFYGESAMEIVQRDPYIVASSQIGGTFGEADKLAAALGFEPDCHERIRAACCYELAFNLNYGHCFIPYEKLVTIASQLIHVDPERVPECIDELAEEGRIVVNLPDDSGTRACYLPEIFEAENYVADRLNRMKATKMRSALHTEPAIDLIEKENHIVYAPEQRETLRQSLDTQLMIITGGPGTGKTTTVRGILSLFEMAGIKYLLAAPTGRAAKRLAELTGRETSTVHRLLGAKRSDDGMMTAYTKKEDDPLSCNAVILDETSMVDVLLMSALLKAMPEDARLICVGDMDQLPPVGPGRVFSAMIRSGTVHTVKLNAVFRQSENSMIVKNAHKINHGELPEMGANTGDFFRLRREEGASSVETVADLCAVRLPQKMKIAPEEIQVLSPSRKGELGTVNLNRELQKILNPKDLNKKEKVYGETVFREGDRVMQIRNNYDILWRDIASDIASTGIYNGDIGYIRRIDPENESMEIDFDGRIALYSFSCLSELEHAWAVTVHKSQGCEFRAVILALSTFSRRLLTRSILYTAVTRAKDILIIVGTDDTVKAMIDNPTVDPRYSYLRQKLSVL